MDIAAKEILKKIRKADIITIFGHINPDGDCYGSGCALREILRDNFKGKKIYTLGYGLEYLYDRLTTYDVIEDEVIKNSLAIVCDVSELNRVSDQRVRLAKEIVKIDHHIESVPFEGTVGWVDCEAIACCQMIAEFAFYFNFKVSKLAAELMYLGIVTDSGRFRYEPTNAITHSVVSKLYELGIDSKSLFDILYQSDVNVVKYQALLVSNFKVTKNHVIYCFADQHDYEQFGLRFEDISKNVNVLGGIRGCPLWLLCTKDPKGFIRVEFRSNGLDVQKIAKKYGGGGHKCAAGCRLDNWTWDQCMAIVDDLDRLAEENK